MALEFLNTLARTMPDREFAQSCGVTVDGNATIGDAVQPQPQDFPSQQ